MPNERASSPRDDFASRYEPAAAGPEAKARHVATLDRLAELLRTGRRSTGGEELPDSLEEGLVSAVTFFVGRPLHRNRPGLLPGLAPELTVLLLRPYVGREEAERLAAEGEG